MTYNPGPFDPRHPYGLPMGTVRGFMSVLICAFFWIALLAATPAPVPLAHFFLLTLVFLAFASHPTPHGRAEFLPWLMRLLFVGGSIAVVGYVTTTDPGRLKERLTPAAGELAVGMWPVLLGTLAGGFGLGLLARYLTRGTELFETVRGWTGIVATILLVAETLFQFVIRPSLSAEPSFEALKVWEGVVVGVTAFYFGTRA